MRDSHDRYANIENYYLLQKMEEYDDIAILTTNLRQNLDAGLIRRLAFTVQFPFPNEASRRKIWPGIRPQDLPREVPPDDLAKRTSELTNKKPYAIEDDLQDALDDMARDIAIIESNLVDWAGWVTYLLERLELEAKRRGKLPEFDGMLISLLHDLQEFSKPFASD